MYGRYGGDKFSLFLLVIALVISFAGAFFWPISLVADAIFIYVLFRMFSRNVYKRRDENAKYLRATAGVRTYFRGLRERWSQRRDYKFFRCPSCRTLLRVPKGKGKIKVVCRKCGNSFIKKT